MTRTVFDPWFEIGGLEFSKRSVTHIKAAEGNSSSTGLDLLGPIQVAQLLIVGIVPTTHSVIQISSKSFLVYVHAVQRMASVQVRCRTEHVVFCAPPSLGYSNGFPLQQIGQVLSGHMRPLLLLHRRTSRCNCPP